MIKAVLLGILMNISVIAFGQNYFITFSASGDTNQIGTVQVVNLATFDTVWLNGSDTLNLIAWGVGLEKYRSESCELNIFPNPMLQDAILSIQSNRGGSAIISVHDMSGRIITSKEEKVNPGETQFRLSGFPKGSYLVRVNGNEIQGAIKVVSNGSDNRPAIDEVTNSMNYKSFKSQNPEKNTATTQIVQMTYNSGDRLQYRGQTGTYRNLAVDIPISSKNQEFHFVTCLDNSGHTYETVGIQINSKKKNSTLDSTYTQTWMAENLNVGEFRTASQGLHNDSVIEKFCYNDSISNCNEYGGLYRWDEMMGYQTEDSVPGICPEGWRLPSKEEWNNLVVYYGGASIAGGKMKEVGTLHWNGNSPGYPPCDNPDATNETGFTAIAGGAWCTDSGIPGVYFFNRYTDGVHWTTTQYNPPYQDDWAWAGHLQCIDGIAYIGMGRKTDAYSVRCIHN